MTNRLRATAMIVAVLPWAGVAAPASDVGLSGEAFFTIEQFLGGAGGDHGANPTQASAGGRIDVTAAGNGVDFLMRLRIDREVLSDDPARALDEAWLRTCKGPVTVQGGLQKPAWGKADSLRVLDVLNPLDLSDLTVDDAQERKIAVPMLRGSVALGTWANLQAVYIPFLVGNKIAYDGLWASNEITELTQGAYGALYASLLSSYTATTWASAYSAAYAQIAAANPTASAAAISAAAATQADAVAVASATSLTSLAANGAEEELAVLIREPDYSSLEDFQAGARLTATLGPVDLGLQYVYGYLTTPVVDLDPATLAANGSEILVEYNRRHQIGADLAFAVAGFSVRAEAALNLTDDWPGDDPTVRNPFVAWAFGFDRDLFLGVNLNVQAREDIALHHDEIRGAYDIEAGAGLTSTVIAASVGQSLLRDTVRWELAGMYEPEEGDFAVAPKVTVSWGDASLVFAGRVFAGDEEGTLGQYADRSYASVSMRYTF